MRRIAAHDESAFEELLRRYEGAVVTFCYSFVRDHGCAEDLAQEAFLRVFRHARRYQPVAKFTTWLYRIAANLCINELKKGRIRRHLSLYEPAGPNPEGTRIIERIAAGGELPLSEVERREALELIAKAINDLPEDQRTTLILVEYHRMPYKDIAGIMGVTLSAIKMRVKRARESLREWLRLSGHDAPE